MDLWGKKEPKHKEQDENPYTKKWGSSDRRGTAALEATRKELITLVRSLWGQMPEEQRNYWKDILDFEREWRSGMCKDWRLFFNQPSKSVDIDSRGLDEEWWHRPLELLDRPTVRQEETPNVPSSSAPVHIKDIMKGVFPDAKETEVALEAQFKKGGQNGNNK